MASFYTKTFSKIDEYMTNVSTWLDIKEYIPKDKVLWDPFYGDGEIAIELEKNGYKVIHKNIDFFQQSKQGDMILTNPPYSKSKDVMKKLAELDMPFIMIMPVSKITTEYMRKYFKDKIQIIIPKKRIHFIQLKDGKRLQTKRANFDCFYYCYKMNMKNDITWLD